MKTTTRSRVRLTLLAGAILMTSTGCQFTLFSHLFHGLSFETCTVYAFEPAPEGLTVSETGIPFVTLGCYDE